MLNEPPIDEMVAKIGSKYALCVVASKRARQLIDSAHNQGLNDVPGGEKPLSMAAKEIHEGKLTVSNF